MTSIVAKKVTVYQVDGKGKSYRTKPAAYLGAAHAIVNVACLQAHDIEHWYEREGEQCRYCSKECDGSPRVKHLEPHPFYGQDSCEGDPTHSYRYRLVGRLARWLRWRDEREHRIARAS